MSSTHPGDAKWNSCWRQAAYLCKHIYKNPAPDGGFKTFYPNKMTEVEQNWETWEEENQQSGTGLVARLYKVKSWDPADAKAPSCPPCLVFRGTDFEDMRDLGFSASIRVQMGAWWTFHFNKLFDPTVPAREEEYTREEFLNMGFTPINILNEAGRVAADGFIFNLTMNADIMARENGDWVSNLYQGLGRGSPQYDQAMKFGSLCVDNKILALADKRMEISGHSLGGGLAAAVCCYLDHNYPDVIFHAITFNAAGVNANTVVPATLSSGTINCFAVEDEVLTTLQSHTATMPFIGAVFRHASRSLGMAAMPPSLGTMKRVRGKSPGGNLGAQGSDLTKLFPMQNANGKSRVPLLAELDGMLLASATISQFAERLLHWLKQRYGERALDDLPWYGQNVISQWVRIWNMFMADLRPEIALVTDAFLHSAEYHGMDVVIATYEASFPA
ncbi:hypothetical protein [Paracoccus saliphilus]|uniref:Lipase (Class 3) n=1 Tax=Paracoccus saliphilus TaxID=405559 RepID=A0AA45W7I2_9RHOB|nr:hypothetical protein [Paracoccus saliphilus]WCR02714.1 hypothetical protein JHX88_18020 [Paracoccus saliphilus]SIT09342.1 hypothetical protein SAMN05421772_11752 [Paracoccus saliphilus]